MEHLRVDDQSCIDQCDEDKLCNMVPGGPEKDNKQKSHTHIDILSINAGAQPRHRA